MHAARWTAVVLPLVACSLAMPCGVTSQAQVPRTAPGCRAARDQVVQALEHLRADSTTPSLADANEFLKRAVDLCGESGEAWYYRSLVEAKLGHNRLAQAAFEHAEMFPSEALKERLNPFELAVPKGTPPLRAVRRKWALVVGIGSFTDPNIPKLNYPRSDAELFRDALVDAKVGGFAPESVRLLEDDTATLRAMKEGVNWLARSAGPDDLVVVYVASHGSARGLDTAGASYVIAHDTEVGPHYDRDALYATALPMVELANAVATRVKARRTAVFLDMCHSAGAITDAGQREAGRAASVSENTLAQMRQGAGRLIFAASQTNEESYESNALRHGYFTYYLVEALRQQPERPLAELFATVRDRVSTSVARDRRDDQQTPVMSRSSDSADFALGGRTENSVALLAR